MELLSLHHGPWIGKLPESAQQPHRGQSHDIQVDVSCHHHRALQKSQHLVEKRAGEDALETQGRVVIRTQVAPDGSKEAVTGPCFHQRSTEVGS